MKSISSCYKFVKLTFIKWNIQCWMVTSSSAKKTAREIKLEEEVHGIPQRGHKVEKEAESEVRAFVVSVGWFGFLG